MKHGGIKAVWLFVLGCIAAVSTYGDEATINLKSIVLESFNGDTHHEYNTGRLIRQYDFSWMVAASKFASQIIDADGNEVQYPISAYLETWPIAAFGYTPPDPLKSFGINGRFDRQGNNWIDIYPVGDDGETPFEIPMPGRVVDFDLWVWGSNLNYTLEAYVRDFEGVPHVIQMGSLAFAGWRNLRARVPHTILQSKRILPYLAELKFIKFRIWTHPSEKVNNFYIYLKQFNIQTNTFETFFDGNELADPDHSSQLWANSAN